MGILLAFAPFLAFALLDRTLGSVEGLLAGAAVAAALLARDWLTPGRTPKLLEIGTFLLFGGLALYAVLAHPDWSLMGVRLIVDAGLLAIVLFSIAIGRPFTLQYAREQVAAEFHDSPRFLRTNMIISGAWAVAFAVIVIADAVLVMMPSWPPRVAILATVAAIVGALKFTDWYTASAKAA